MNKVIFNLNDVNLQYQTEENIDEDELSEDINSEEVHEIITAVPSWILRWGISLIFAIVMGIILLSALIEYPDVIKTELKINSLNSPKAVLAKLNGKLISLLVQDGQMVSQNQPLAFLESTANPNDVILANKKLKKFRDSLFKNLAFNVQLPTRLNLGELQTNYQNFFQQYLQYQSTQKNGFYLKKMFFLEKDLKDITALRVQLNQRKEVQSSAFANSEQEYFAYQKLYNKKVISRSEFTEQENKYLSSKLPLQQLESELLNNTSSFSSKEKELLDLKHTINEEQAKFLQSLNECINQSESWMMQHVLSAPFSGKVNFAGIVQQNQNVITNQELFIVSPGNSTFFGEIQIPQYNMGKIKIGESALIKMKSYPFEQYGIIRGQITFISDAAYRDSIFLAKVSLEKFENKDQIRKIKLKNGMQADVEIITEESSLLQRFTRNVIKMIHSGN